MKRRSFLQQTALASLAVSFPANYTGLLEKIGLNLFSVPRGLSQDLEGTIKMLAGLGYKELEIFGPYPFSTEEAKKGWEKTGEMLGFRGSGFFGKGIADFRKILQDNGMSVPSLHTDLGTLDKNMGPLAEAASFLGARYLTLPALPEENRKTLDDYKKSASLFNKIGTEARSKGVRFAYHNHGYGYSKMDGVVPVEMLYDQTDPDLVFLEMDLFWTTAGGADPVEQINKRKNRFRMMHVKDMKTKVRFRGDGGSVPQWMELFPEMTTAGSGVLDLKKIISTAKANGMEHFFVEQDLVRDPEISLKKSFDHLAGL